MLEHKTLIFVIAVLYSLDEKWRGVGSSESFENILRGRRGVNLHMAWLKLKKEGLLEEFADQFYFDTLYQTSSLNEIVSLACRQYMLVRLGGSDLSYHLDDVDPGTMMQLIGRENISGEKVQKVAARLGQLLEEEAADAHSPTNV